MDSVFFDIGDIIAALSLSRFGSLEPWLWKDFSFHVSDGLCSALGDVWAQDSYRRRGQKNSIDCRLMEENDERRETKNIGYAG
jgi:hypothetical protein